MTRLDTNGYYALGIPAYVLLILVEFLVARWRGRSVFGFADSIGNLSAGLGEVMLGIFIGPVLIALYDYGYEHIALIHWETGSVWPWVVAFVLSDFCYYCYHRAGHRVAALWAIHGVHHQSEEFNVTVAMRHPWFSDAYSAVFYIPLPLLGIPPTHFFVAISVISFYALTIHTRFFHRPSLYVFTTPATHVLHHATNSKYIGRNLGAMFTVWDRMFGTYVAPDECEPPRLGTRSGYETHDGARSQWVLWRRLWLATRQARTRMDVLRIWLGPPGWLPPYAPGAQPHAPRPPRDADLARRTKIAVASAFAGIVALSTYVLWARDSIAASASVLATAFVLWSLGAIGKRLDARVG